MERDFTGKAIELAAKRRGCHWERMPDTGRRHYNAKPFGGILMLWGKIAVYLEFKIENKVLSAEQHSFAVRCHELGMDHYVPRIFREFIALTKINKEGLEKPICKCESLKDMIGELKKRTRFGRRWLNGQVGQRIKNFTVAKPRSRGVNRWRRAGLLTGRGH